MRIGYEGEPVRSWLMLRAETAPAMMADLLRTEWAVMVVCYGGLLFDLLVVPLLLWGKTRVLAFGCAAAFHLANNWLFSIGVFPWLGLALTALFFPPDAPRRWLGFLGFDWLRRLPAPNSAIDASAFTRRVVPVFLATYLVWQLLMPLRHFIYPGVVGWTEEGQRFGWQMKLRWKYGQTRFYLSDPNTRETWIVEPDRYLTPRQVRKMNGHPDMIAQFAKHLATIMATQGRTNVQVRTVARASLNDRAPRLIVDPNVDLARVKRGPPAPWILALDNNATEPAWSGERDSTILPHTTALHE